MMGKQFTAEDESKKTLRSRFQRHANILMWKSYLQRQRRWRSLVVQTLFAVIVSVAAVFIAKPVFLTPLQAEPEPPLRTPDLLNSLKTNCILGFAPNVDPYKGIMSRAAVLLQREIIGAATEDELTNNLYDTSKGIPISGSVIWIIWKPMDGSMWKFSIRSTELARYKTKTENTSYHNPHLRAGFLAVQMATSQAIVEHAATERANFKISLVAMPVSPLMQRSRVKKALSGIMLCFTLALIPPVFETVALVVHETFSRYKRALLIRGVDYSTIYVSWIIYAFLTALPICIVVSITFTLIFRWIHIASALVLMLAYFLVMMMQAFILAMFFNTAWIACVWCVLSTLLQTYLAELLVHHKYDLKHGALTFLMNMVLPPLGLVHALNQYALLQTGRGGDKGDDIYSLYYTLCAWGLLMLMYFLILMLLQRTIGQNRAIGGQVSWKSIIFKQAEDPKKLNPIETPTGRERDPLQEVDELVAKAISFRDVSKSIVGVQILSKVTLDIYRGEFTMIFAERIQETMINTIEDLLAGLTFADHGSIHVLGHILKPKKSYMAVPHMMGYCHRSSVLIEDLTVQEHITLFLDICLWSESRQYIAEYGEIRSSRLYADCNLEVVRLKQVRDLDAYYRAQLCWAIAMLLEPRIIMVGNFTDTAGFVNVIKDKIQQYKKYVTMVNMCYSSIQLEYADRIFLFDNKILTFGGTPAYMFFKYGREYRVRLTLRSDGTVDDDSTAELLNRATAAGATIRAHLGLLLILRLPASPTENVANLVDDLLKNANNYGLMSLNISVADSEEVYRRVIKEARAATHEPRSFPKSKDALKRISEPILWKRKNTVFSNITQLRNIGWKYFSFYAYYYFILIVTVLSALAAGAMIGLSFSKMLALSEQENIARKLLHADILTVEYAGQMTTLVLRADNSNGAISVANAYVFSEPNATAKQVDKMMYTAIIASECITEYLVTRAIDSPQQYVYMYAYGLDVFMKDNRTLVLRALYSPLHQDKGAAARSMARSYTALLRHYTGNYEASIQVTDDPLALDLTPWMKYATEPPLVIQFLLILSISHITLLPSKEYGLIRHTQSHAMNFSPARYWFTLYFCDLILYWIIVALMTVVMMLVMYFAAPAKHFQYEDLLVVSFLLFIYGFGCIPQAYLFSLGPRAALNSMTFVIFSILFGETTVIAKILYGDTLNFALLFVSLSPQYNIAYALAKAKQIFLYNSECIIFKSKNLCSANFIHKCCQKCGVLQKCFSKKNFLSLIHTEVIALTTTAIVFMMLLLLLEYQIIQRTWKQLVSFWIAPLNTDTRALTPGAAREKQNVLNKMQQVKTKRNQQNDTFGECLLAQDLARKEMGIYTVHSIFLGLGEGEALALSGLKRHGRLKLCEMLAGYHRASHGAVWSMSKWKQNTQPHKYARQISFSCERQPVPHWMTVYDALELTAILRGVPKKNVKAEIWNHIEALELESQADIPICHMTPFDRTRLHFAAAVVGAPPVIVLDECIPYQKFSVRRAIYFILCNLRKRGHAIFLSSSSVESHMPVTNRLAIILDGSIYDIDTVDNLVGRYSHEGYTVVLHLKDKVNVTKMFAEHFRKFFINDTSEVLVNVQVLDADLDWAKIFQKMEVLKSQNTQVYSYIVTVIAIDYIYNSILLDESGNKPSGDFVSGFRKTAKRSRIKPSKEYLAQLKPLEKKYDITKLKELPWSVIFNR